MWQEPSSRHLGHQGSVSERGLHCSDQGPLARLSQAWPVCGTWPHSLPLGGRPQASVMGGVEASLGLWLLHTLGLVARVETVVKEIKTR